MLDGSWCFWSNVDHGSVRVATRIIGKGKHLRRPRTTASQTFDTVLWNLYVVYKNKDQLFYYRDVQGGSKSQLLQKTDFDELSEDHRFTTLHKIVCGIDLHDLSSEASNHPGDLNQPDRYGRTPLWHAVAHGNTQFVRYLLGRGCNPNLGGSAIISEAIKWDGLEIVELLIASGLNFRDLNINDLLLGWRTFNGSYSSDLLRDCWTIESLIIRHWVKVNQQTTSGKTLLMFVCSRQRCSAVNIRQLVRRGADLELRNANGDTVLLFCIKKQRRPDPDALLTLIYAGARLDVQDHTGASILHHFVLCESYGTFGSRLLRVMILKDVDSRQFDLDARDEDGYTAFDLLKKRNGITWWSYYTAKRGKGWRRHDYHEIRCEIQCIRSLESLFHHIQDSQGIPVEQQYPPLADYLCEQPDDKRIPGAWPL